MVSVQDYLEKHKLSIRIEEAVNAAVRAQSEDPVAYIANHLRKHSVAVITKVEARQVLDSRGVPTIEASIHTSRGCFSAIAPSGLAASIYSADELRDSEGSGFLGRMGVRKAVGSVGDVLGPVLLGKDPREQADLDKLMTAELDKGSHTPQQLGANAVRAVSFAICKAGAAEKDLHAYEHIADLGGFPVFSIPAPLFTLLRGGPRKANAIPFKEILCLPVKAENYSEALRIGVEVSHALVDAVRDKIGEQGVRFSEGGELMPPVASLREGFELVLAAAEASGHREHMRLGLDASAGDIFDPAEGLYDLGTGVSDLLPSSSPGAMADGTAPAPPEAAGAPLLEQANGGPGAERRRVTREELGDFYRDLVEAYNLSLIIDPFEIEDFQSPAALTRAFEDTGVRILGGDMLAGNIKRIAQAAASRTCHGQDLKVPSVGTMTDAISTVRAARDADWTTSLACSPGESEDSVLADLAVGTGVQFFRAGPIFGSQHTAKLNRMSLIEEQQAGHIPYLQPDFSHREAAS